MLNKKQLQQLTKEEVRKECLDLSQEVVDIFLKENIIRPDFLDVCVLENRSTLVVQPKPPL